MTAGMVAVVYLAIGGAVLASAELLAQRYSRRAGMALGPCSPFGLAMVVVTWPGFLLALIVETIAVVRARRG